MVNLLYRYWPIAVNNEVFVMPQSGRRIVTLLLLGTLVVIANCSTLMPKANAIPTITLESRQSNDASTNLGTITLDGTTYDPLPKDVLAISTDFQVTYNPASGFRFVRWENEGIVSFDDPNSQTTQAHIQDVGDVTIRAVYESIPVGGIAIPVNKLAILAPYLALMGLVGAVTAALAVRRRKP